MIFAPIISSDVAVNFNKRVQNEIDGRLFFFCNYQPTVFPAVNEDGYFKNSVMDLYKFALDSTFLYKKLTRKNNGYLNKTEIEKFDNIRDIIDQISMLRSVFGHSQSEENGFNEKNLLEQADLWVAQKLGKSTGIESSEDYAKLNAVLESMAKVLLDETDRLINFLKTHARKENIKEKWIDDTIEWFADTSKSSIFRGVLMDNYIARAAAKGNYPAVNELNRKIDKWIHYAYTYPIDCAIKKKKDEKNSLVTYNENVARVLVGMTAAQRAKFDQHINEQKNKLNKELDDLMKEKKNAPNSKQFHKYHLKGVLEETKRDLENAGEEYTLFPNDFIQSSIDKKFYGIPSPENDF